MLRRCGGSGVSDTACRLKSLALCFDQTRNTKRKQVSRQTTLPVAVIGAGPVGLAAAAHLMEPGITPVVLERGARVGASVAEWGHVQLFSP